VRALDNAASHCVLTQSLFVRCCRYHASRESFLYVKTFYIGEVSPQDRALVPQPQPGPSVEFIEQLKAFTISFRLPVTGAYKSF
jgi:hypothetical protein